jgi:SAM-dependent methyltransferase
MLVAMADDFWEHAARQDPLWAILSDPVMAGRRWSLDEFFESGRREISLLEYQLRRLGRVPRRERALDFGCGVGRLTQALAPSFAEVIGIDASPTMIALANRLNRHPGSVRYVLNQSPRLEQIGPGTVDLVYSDIVLQHVEPEAARGYIAEFLRILRPGGITVFQLPSHKRPASALAGQPVSMPLEAYDAELQIVSGPPEAMAAGHTATIVVDVVNARALSWDQGSSGSIRLGNHWRSRGGAMLIQDDGRAVLPARLEPGERCSVAIEVQAPPEAGEFLFEIDLVHEGISWFGDRGSRTTSQSVAVESSAASTSDADAPGAVSMAETPYPDIYAGLPPEPGEIGHFPMHGIPRDEVLALIGAQGGDAFYIENDERGGPEWEGYRYYVVKSGVL